MIDSLQRIIFTKGKFVLITMIMLSLFVLRNMFRIYFLHANSPIEFGGDGIICWDLARHCQKMQLDIFGKPHMEKEATKQIINGL